MFGCWDEAFSGGQHCQEEREGKNLDHMDEGQHHQAKEVKLSKNSATFVNLESSILVG